MSIIKSLHQRCWSFLFPSSFRLPLNILSVDFLPFHLLLVYKVNMPSNFFLCFFVGPLFWTPAHHILVRSEDGGSDDSQEQADHVEHHWGPQQAVQVDHIPAAADPGELVILCVVLCAGRAREQTSKRELERTWLEPPYLCVFNYYYYKKFKKTKNPPNCPSLITFVC